MARKNGEGRFVVIGQRLLLFLVLVNATIISSVGIYIVTSPTPSYRGIEQNVVFTIETIVAGGVPYSDPTRPPYSIAQYAPLYYFLCAGASSLFGLSPDDSLRITQLARFLSLFFLVLSIGLIYRILNHRLKVSPVLSCIGAGLGFILTSPWNFIARPDSLMDLCLIASLYFFLGILAEQKNRRRRHIWLIGAIVCAVLGAAAKQSGMQALLLITIYMAINKQWKYLLYMGIGLALVLLLTLATKETWLGPAVKANVIDGVRNGVDLLMAVRTTYSPFLSYFAVLCAASLAIAPSWIRKGNPQEVFLGLTVFVFFCFATAIGAKRGSAINYYNEFIIVSVIVVLYFFSTLPRRLHPPGPFVKQFMSFIILYVAIAPTMWSVDQLHDYILQPRVSTYSAPIPARYDVATYLRQQLAEHPGTFVYAEDQVIANLLPDRSILPQRVVTEMSTELELVDYSNLASQFRTGEIRFLVFRRGMPPSPILNIPVSHYQHLRDVGNYSIYVYPD